MTQASLKKAIKQAVIEVVREQPQPLTNALAEAMEHVALLAAIREGEDSKPVTREQVFLALRGSATNGRIPTRKRCR